MQDDGALGFKVGTAKEFEAQMSAVNAVRADAAAKMGIAAFKAIREGARSLTVGEAFSIFGATVRSELEKKPLPKLRQKRKRNKKRRR